MNVRMMFKLAALVLGTAAAVGCTSDDGTADRAPIHVETQVQLLGEASQAVTFSGIGAGDMPTYDERVAVHLMNRVRTAPYMWGFMIDTDGDMMPDAPLPPKPAMRYQQFFSEAGRWQGDHSIANQCFCPYSMEDEGQQNATCCAMDWVNSEAACAGPRVECNDMEGRTTRQDRWAMLNNGPGEIRNEYFWAGGLEGPGTVPGEAAAAHVLNDDPNKLNALVSERQNAVGVAQVTSPIVPPDCVPPEDTCTVGTCTDTESGNTTCDEGTNPDCLGICQGEGTDEENPQPCSLPEPIDPIECDPANYDNAFYYSFSFGRSSEPTPVLTDGVAFQLTTGSFGMTPDGDTEFAIHYYEPAGAPRSIQTVVEGECIAMDFWVEPPNLGGTPAPPVADMGTDMGDMGDMGDVDMGTPEEATYVGITYSAFDQLGTGCHRYVFDVVDGEGFIARYPTLGSLGVLIENGIVVSNTSACPAWASEAVDSSCLGTGDQCTNGDTRACYTGRDGTQDFGLCGSGTETCEMGRWNGFCEGETRPDPEEICNDEIDNNCNGSVDEGCPVIVPPPNNDNNDNNDNNANNTNPDMGESDMGTTEPPDDGDKDDEGCGCTTVEGPRNASPWALFLAAAVFGLGVIRRRR